LQLLKGRCHDNQFYGQNRPTHLHLSPLHSKTDWIIAILILQSSMAIIYIICKFDEIRSVTPEFETERHTSLVYQQFSYVRLAAILLDASSISTEFCGAITTQFCFTYSLGGVTAMPRGLHDRLCHAFLVLVLLFASQRIN